MSEQAKAARAAMRDKAKRLVKGDPRAKVDASSWTPPEMMNTGAKTGLRPISRRQFKRGGKVAGECGPMRADRAPRKTGGLVKEWVNRNVKEANAEDKGKPHTGGLKHGGKADEAADKKMVKKAMRQHETAQHGGKHAELKLKKGGKARKADGGMIAPTQADVKEARGILGSNMRENPADMEAAREVMSRYKQMGVRPLMPQKIMKADGGAADGDKDDDAKTPSYNPGYSREAVDKAIASSNRAGRKISAGEAKKIHSLLRGRYADGGDVTGKTLDQIFEGIKTKLRARAAGAKSAKRRIPVELSPDEQEYFDKYRGDIMQQMRDEAKASPRIVQEEPEVVATGAGRGAGFMGMPGRKKGGKVGNYEGGTRPTGGRMARKSGGRTKKGKTDIKIVIAAGGGRHPLENMPMMGGPVRPPAAPVVAPPPAGGVPPMPMGMPPAGGPAPGPLPGLMGRKTGGRVGHRTYRSYKDMDAGSLGGMGRLEKTEIEKNKRKG